MIEWPLPSIQQRFLYFENKPLACLRNTKLNLEVSYIARKTYLKTLRELRKVNKVQGDKNEAFEII